MEAVFAGIQRQILADANSFCWLNYASPKRGDATRKLAISIPENTDTSLEATLELEFNSGEFADLTGGLLVNRGVATPDGIESIAIQGNTPFLAEAFTLLSATAPVYAWELANPTVAQIAVLDSSWQIQINPLANGTTTLTVRDTANEPILGSAYQRTLSLTVSRIVPVKLFLPQRISDGSLAFSFGYADGSAMQPGDETRFLIRSTADFQFWTTDAAPPAGRYFQVVEKPRQN